MRRVSSPHTAAATEEARALPQGAQLGPTGTSHFPRMHWTTSQHLPHMALELYRTGCNRVDHQQRRPCPWRCFLQRWMAPHLSQREWDRKPQSSSLSWLGKAGDRQRLSSGISLVSSVLFDGAPSANANELYAAGSQCQHTTSICVCDHCIFVETEAGAARNSRSLANSDLTRRPVNAPQKTTQTHKTCKIAEILNAVYMPCSAQHNPMGAISR